MEPEVDVYPLPRDKVDAIDPSGGRLERLRRHPRPDRKHHTRLRRWRRWIGISAEMWADLRARLLQQRGTRPTRGVFLPALRDVARARAGVAKLAEMTDLNREHLYRMLSEKDNQELRSLEASLDALGFRLAVTQKETS